MENLKEEIIATFYKAMDIHNHFEAGFLIDKEVIKNWTNKVKELENEGYVKNVTCKSNNNSIATVMFTGKITDKGLDLVKELNISKNI